MLPLKGFMNTSSPGHKQRSRTLEPQYTPLWVQSLSDTHFLPTNEHAVEKVGLSYHASDSHNSQLIIRYRVCMRGSYKQKHVETK